MLEAVLDYHATMYAGSTMEYITRKITESERQAIWHETDEKSKAAIQRLFVRERLDEAQHVRRNLIVSTKVDIDPIKMMDDRIKELQAQLNKEERAE
ncbi:hypothetical protein DVS77_21690 [Mycolicibacterium moriokaense]|nr:hypothetical protein DVS77_21690 [Mycolicibacterium moriokaense]